MAIKQLNVKVSNFFQFENYFLSSMAAIIGEEEVGYGLCKKVIKQDTLVSTLRIAGKN